MSFNKFLYFAVVRAKIIKRNFRADEFFYFFFRLLKVRCFVIARRYIPVKVGFVKNGENIVERNEGNPRLVKNTKPGRG
ncbi:MAG: hypothetical protein LBK02_05820 [Treponema sp.]|nr:hypothetical protein [Treponema sp.]